MCALQIFGLEPLEEAADAVPHARPRLAPGLPFGLAFEHPLLLRAGELAPGGIERDSALPGVLHEVVLAVAVGSGLPRPHRAFAQRFRLVRHDEPVVEADDAPEAAARLARAERRGEREEARRGLAVVDVAVRAVQVGGESPDCR